MEEKQEETKKTQEQIEKERLEEFLTIKDQNDTVLYKTSTDELQNIVSDVLSMGSYTHEFTLLNGKLVLVYTTILEKDRQFGYEQIRAFTNKNENASRIQIETFTSKVNLALHTVRIISNDVPTNLTTGKFEERLVLLGDLPEQLLLSLDKYLRVFLNLVNRAFNSEDIIKN